MLKWKQKRIIKVYNKNIIKQKEGFNRWNKIDLSQKTKEFLLNLSITLPKQTTKWNKKISMIISPKMPSKSSKDLNF